MGWLSDWSAPFARVLPVDFDEWLPRLPALWTPWQAQPSVCTERFDQIEALLQQQVDLLRASDAALRQQLADLAARVPIEETAVEAVSAQQGRHGDAVRRVLTRAQHTATSQGLTPPRPRKRS